MKKTVSASLMTLAMVLGQAAVASVELEPCINGSVSSSGLFESEDAQMIAEEPCLNGDVLPGDE